MVVRTIRLFNYRINHFLLSTCPIESVEDENTGTAGDTRRDAVDDMEPDSGAASIYVLSTGMDPFLDDKCPDDPLIDEDGFDGSHQYVDMIPFPLTSISSSRSVNQCLLLPVIFL